MGASKSKKERFTPNELLSFRGKLISLKRETKKVQSMNRAVIEKPAENSFARQHNADYSDNGQRETCRIGISNNCNNLLDFDKALEKIDDGTYGICHNPKCSVDIPEERLIIVPQSIFCVACEAKIKCNLCGMPVDNPQKPCRTCYQD